MKSKLLTTILTCALVISAAGMGITASAAAVNEENSAASDLSGSVASENSDSSGEFADDIISKTGIESSAASVNVETYKDFQYTVSEENTVEIYKYTGSDASVTVPDTIDGKTVTAIGGRSFYDNRTLSSVTIPKTITVIRSSAFSSCRALTEINLPKGLTAIEDSAFANCVSLTGITIPNTVTSVGNNAFYNCSSITSLILPNSIESIGSQAFNYCSAATELSIPDSVKSIGNYAFAHTNISAVTIPDNIENMGNYVFASCKALTGIVIPSTFTSVNTGTFSDCKSLSSVTIPNSVTSIGNYAFSGCTGLTSVNLPESIDTIGTYAFQNCTGLTEFTIPKKVTKISSYMFYGCSSLTSVSIHNGVTCIDTSAFENCTALPSVNLPDSVTEIGSSAFENCESFTNFKFPKNITVISEDMFKQCSGLTEFTIPNTITRIESHAFSLCSNLSKITIPNTVEYVGSYAFYSCKNLPEITLPNSITQIGTAAFSSCSSIKEITLPNSVNTLGTSVFSSCSKLEKITLPNGIETIPYNTFSSCTSLTNITLPDSVTAINGSAFYGCKALESVNIPSGVTTINSYAFYNCSSLKSLELPEGLTVINEYVLFGCKALTSVKIPDSVLEIKNDSMRNCTGLTEIVIPEQVTAIGNYAFEDCTNLRTITIPKSVENIGSWAFRDCADLTIRGYKGSAAYTYAKEKGFYFYMIDAAKLLNKSTVNSTQLYLGDKLTVTGTASGGTEEGYTYAYYYKQSKNSSWITLGTEFGTDLSASFTPAAAVNYDIKVKVSDSNKTVTQKTFKVNVAPALVNSSEINATEIYAGDKLTMTGKASGGLGGYKYAFYYKQHTNSNWIAVGDLYGAVTTASIRPSVLTDYDIMIRVMDKNGKKAEIKRTVKVAYAALQNNSTLSSSNICAGDKLVLTGNADGGAGGYKYAFYYKQSSTTGWRAIGDLYGSASSASIKLSNVTDYDIMIRVKDKNNKMTEKRFSVNVGKALENNSSISAEKLYAGNKLTLTGAASGGLGEYKYSYYYKQSSSDGWRAIGDLNVTDATASIRLSNITDYDIMIRVRDEDGRKADKIFKVTVAKALENTSSVSSSKIKAGSKLTLTGKASGGAEEYRYSYYYKQSSTNGWRAIGDLNVTDTTASIKLSNVTNYDIMIRVRDKDGNKADKVFSVTVTK